MNSEGSKMTLCKECWGKLKHVPNIVKKGIGITCFGGFCFCEECRAKITHYVIVEISNENIEPKAICSCGIHEVTGGDVYCDLCLAAKKENR